MARIMSFVMGVFILVPALAPALGQLVLALSHWRAIFVCFLVLALLMWIWFGLRQCETLPPDKRHAFSLARIGRAMHETCTHRIALGYMLAAGFVFGGLVAYLVLAQQILQIQYELGAAFPLYFGVLALAIGAASYLNGRLVVRYGMKHLSEQALWVMSASSFGFIVVALQTLGHPPLWLLMAYLLLVFFCLGFVFGNFNALAMQPLGHIAGSAAAAIGAVTTVMSMVLGGIVGQAYDGSVVPLVGAFAVYGSAALLASRWAEGSG